MNRRPFRSAPLAAGAVLVLAALAAPLVTPAAPAAATQKNRTRAPVVQVKVVDVTPTTAPASQVKRPLIVTLDLTNTTTTALRDVVVTAVRGDPVESQTGLNAVIRDTTPPATTGPVTPTRPVRVDLPADGTAHRVTFATTIGIPLDSGVCQCAPHAVYPLYFSAGTGGTGGTGGTAGTGGVTGTTGHVLGSTVTFVPSFYEKPAPVGVSWVWPLIDHPHRVTGSTVFTDDTLATSVAAGGRLDRSLAVVEQVASTVPLTLVVDPELLDELAVMAGEKYTVSSGAPGTTPLPGIGQAPAAAWLQRFRAVLESHPSLQVELTPYADPDVQSLSLQNLRWRTSMPAEMRARVAQALGTRVPDSSLAWPAGGAYTARTLDTLVGQGVRSAILPATALTPRDGAAGTVPAGTARVTRAGQTVAVADTSAAVQRYAATVVSRGGDGTGSLPQLLAEIAIRAAQAPTSSHTLVVTPPRYVDPDVAVAVRAIRATSRSPFAAPIALERALAPARLPLARSRLAAFPPSAPTLPPQTTASAADVTGKLPAISSLLSRGGRDAATLIAGLPVGLQRIESSYWLTHPSLARAPADALVKQVDALTSGVSIVPPHTGAYTLGSSTSPLPVTVQNNLQFPVLVRLQVTTVNGLPGFTAHDIGAQQIDATARRTLHLPTSILRSGRIQIQAQLLTPRKQAIGEPVTLSVHSTAFGTIGVIITIAGGAVLVLALLIRAARQLRARRDKQRAAPVRPRRAPVAEVPGVADVPERAT